MLLSMYILVLGTDTAEGLTLLFLAAAPKYISSEKIPLSS
jgi:hypothetical protein